MFGCVCVCVGVYGIEYYRCAEDNLKTTHVTCRVCASFVSTTMNSTATTCMSLDSDTAVSLSEIKTSYIIPQFERVGFRPKKGE